jgi:hypothetical protein
MRHVLAETLTVSELSVTKPIVPVTTPPATSSQTNSGSDDAPGLPTGHTVVTSERTNAKESDASDLASSS